MTEERRLAAIMFSDICGFSAIMGSDEEQALAIVEMHKNCVADGARMHGGRIAKEMGDGLLVEFSSAVNAVRCAIDVQKAVSDFNKTAAPEEAFQLRIGIHVGDVVVAGDDILGDGVNVASRIIPLAEPGGICISRDLFDLVRSKISLETVNLGAHDLKNISRQVSIYKVLIDAVAPGGRGTSDVAKKTPILKYAMIAGAALIGLVAATAIITHFAHKNRSSIPQPAAARPITETPPPPHVSQPQNHLQLPKSITDNPELTHRHLSFVRALLDKNREQSLSFLPPEFLRESDEDQVWRKMSLFSGLLQLGLNSREDLKIKSIHLTEDGRSADVVMRRHLHAVNGNPEAWKELKPVRWKLISGTWYLDPEAMRENTQINQNQPHIPNQPQNRRDAPEENNKYPRKRYPPGNDRAQPLPRRF